MNNIDPYLSLVDVALTLCSTIYVMVKKVKTNKVRCQQIGNRVLKLKGLVLTIKPGRISGAVERALRDLCSSLDTAKTLMEKFSKENAVVGFLKSGSHEDKFLDVEKRLTDDIQMLSWALLIEQGNTLHDVCETVTGCRQPHTSPTAPQHSNTPHMTTCSPTAPPFQNTCSPTAPPFHNTCSPTTPPFQNTCSPTAPPFQNTFSPTTTPNMAMRIPTTPYFQGTVPTMTMWSPTSHIPFQSNMSTMTMCSPTTVPYIMPSMTMSSSMSCMSSTSSLPFSSTTATNSAMSMNTHFGTNY